METMWDKESLKITIIRERFRTLSKSVSKYLPHSSKPFWPVVQGSVAEPATFEVTLLTALVAVTLAWTVSAAAYPYETDFRVSTVIVH